jgi:hypothetical protein
MYDYKSKRTNEAVERIKMVIDEESSAELAMSGMCDRLIKCLQNCKDLAGIDDYKSLDFKRCAANRVESIVNICASTAVLRDGIDDTAVMRVVDTLLKDLEAYADLDVYQVMDMYFLACAENRPRIIKIYAGEPGCGKTTRATQELQSYLAAGKDAVLYDDMPANTNYNKIIKNDKHEVILVTTCQC